MSDQKTEQEARELSPLIVKRLHILFREYDWDAAALLLMDQCSVNLPRSQEISSAGIERIQAAVLKRSGGNLEDLKAAIETAKFDWRDALYYAGFHNDTKAHLEWLR